MRDNNYKIYKHIHKINNKIYIGATKQNPERRWRKGEGYKRNIYFYRAIQKDGWDSFEHIVLFDNLTKQEAEDIEIELIAYHNSTNSKFGYNIESGGILNKEISKESRLKMSLAKKCKMLGDKNPNYGKHLSEECKMKISKTRKERNIQAWNKGIKNCFSNETIKKMSLTRKGKMSGENNPMYGKTGINSPYHKEIICLNTLKVYSCAKEASRELNLFPNLITRVCKGKQSQTGGYKFMYLEDYNKFYNLRIS